MLDLANDSRPYKVRLDEAVAKVTPEQVKKIKSMMLGEVEGVKTVGDISRALNIELMIVANVITNNIETVSHHRFKDEWK